MQQIPFSDFAAGVLGRSLARPQTVEGYHTLVGHMLPRLGSVPMEKITRAHVLEAVVDARDKGLAPKTLANMVGLLRTILSEVGNTAAQGVRVAVPDPDVRPLSSDEATALRSQLQPGVATHDAILALLGSGVRLAELERLRPQDWDSAKGYARVTNHEAGLTKSGRTRTVDVASYAREAVTRIVERGMPARRTLQRHLKVLCVAAGIPAVRVHDLRHTRITLLLLAQAPVLYVSAQAGHHDPSYTMRVYGHLIVASEEQRAVWADAA